MMNVYAALLVLVSIVVLAQEADGHWHGRQNVTKRNTPDYYFPTAHKSKGSCKENQDCKKDEYPWCAAIACEKSKSKKSKSKKSKSRKSKCYPCRCRSLDQCVYDKNSNLIMCDCTGSGFEGVYCENMIDAIPY